MPGHRSAKYRGWTEETMEKAYQDVKDRGMPVAVAAKLHNVPRRSLGDRVNGKVPLGAVMGATTKLSGVLEKQILIRMEMMSSMGTPLTVSQILLYAQTLDKELGGNKFGPKGPSYNWWMRFRNVHPEATKKIKRLVEPTKPTDTTVVPDSLVDYLREYFMRLKGLLEQYNLMDKPERIYFCDEAIVDLSRSARPVVKSSWHSSNDIVEREQHVALVSCVSAAGAVMPPCVVFKGDFPTGDYTTGGPDACLYAKSESGFLDTSSIQQWFEELFLKHCRQDRGMDNMVILIMDGPLSLFQEPFLLKAIENNVLFITKVPQIANLDLPLDIHIYKSLEDQIGTFVRYSQALQNPGWIVEFPRLLKTPWEKSMSLYNIKEGFRQCGIYPFNPNAVDKERLVQSRQIKDIDVDLSIDPVLKDVARKDAGDDASELAEQGETFSAIIINQDTTAGNVVESGNVVFVTSADCTLEEHEVETTCKTPTKKKKRLAKSPSRARGKEQKKKRKTRRRTKIIEEETESSEDDGDTDDVVSSDDE